MNKSQLSWKDANASCLLANHPNRNLAQENVSYWIGIYGKNTCSSRLVESLKNETDEIKIKNCSYVSRNSNKTSSDDCDKDNHFICVKAGKV